MSQRSDVSALVPWQGLGMGGALMEVQLAKTSTRKES